MIANIEVNTSPKASDTLISHHIVYRNSIMSDEFYDPFDFDKRVDCI